MPELTLVFLRIDGNKIFEVCYVTQNDIVGTERRRQNSSLVPYIKFFLSLIPVTQDIILTFQEGTFRFKINQTFYRREQTSFFGTKSYLLQVRWEFLFSKRTVIYLFNRRLKSRKWRSLFRIFWLNCIIANPVGKDIQFNRVTLTGMSRLLIMTYISIL